MHSCSNLCHSNVSSTDYVSNLTFDREKSIAYSRPRISNVWEKSTFQIRQNHLAQVGFLPEPDLEKVPDSGQSQSQSRNPVQPYFRCSTNGDKVLTVQSHYEGQSNNNTHTLRIMGTITTYIDCINCNQVARGVFEILCRRKPQKS